MKKVMSRQVSKSVSLFAVDPGGAGGIAFTDGTETLAQGLGEDVAAVDFIRRLRLPNSVAYMEQVGGYIGKEQPGSHMFNFGDSYGYMRGLFDMADIPLKLVRPQKWMRGVLPGVIGLEYDERKRALKQYAQELHPGITVTLKLGDALCLLEYAKRAEAGEFRAGISAPVANTSGNYAQDAKAAAKWAKAQGWQVPKRGSKEHVAMVNYYCQHIRQ